MMSGSGDLTHFSAELQCLLRYRLRLAALIFAIGCGLFLIKSFLSFGREFGSTIPDVILHGLTVAVSFGVFGLLSTRWPMTLSALRTVELVFFGTAAVFFSWLQYVNLQVHLDKLPVTGWEPPAMLFVTHLFVSMVGVRWMILAVIYGTFIPNTWKRCAIVVGILTLWPVLLTMGIGVFDARLLPHLVEVVLVLALLMAVTAAIAVFGSYKISELSQQAHEAKQFGQYRLKRLIGGGGMGEVHLCEHVLLRRPCAMKLVRPEQAGDPRTLSRFEREVRATAQLTHPNTVEIYDYGRTDDGTFYYVMEYLPGLSLETMVEKHGPLPPSRAVHFLMQVCRALREAHQLGVIHRDVKPSNILVCERGAVPDVAKLLDFGLVQSPLLETTDDKLTQHGTILGSPPYMSPEQAAGKPVDPRSDVYGLGGVGYFLLTGQPPFIRDTAMQLLLAHAYESPQPPRTLRPEIPEDVEQVILRCLEKDPEKRYQDVRTVEVALSECGCAKEWSEDKAAVWWRKYPPDETTESTTNTNALEATTV